MKQARIFLTMTVALMVVSCSTKQPSMDEFITSLMQQMTIEEKLGQLNLPVSGEVVTGNARNSNVAENIRLGLVGGLFNTQGATVNAELQRIAVEESRLGIPLIFGMDVIHGYKTIFPIPLAMSCSWDMDAVRTMAQISAKEATADGVCWTFSPMVDICHDARWGRIAEGAGEDPFLGSCVAKAMVEGYQGNDLSDSTTMMACVKHFALYGAPDGGLDYSTVDMSSYRMYNDYLAPYQAAVEAGAGSVMASFNTINGVPATCNKWLLTDLLRKDWGFDGFVVSDYTGVKELMAHTGCTSLEQVSIQSLKAGLDMDMVSEGLVSLAEAYRRGDVSKAEIDQACRRVLEAKYKLGLFDNPYRYCDTTRHQRDVFTPEHRAIARSIAPECMVLLRNENNLLPLSPHQTIALIGPLADTKTNMAGTWSVSADLHKSRTLREGLTDALAGQGTLLYAKGCNLMYDAQAEADATMFGRAMRDTRSPETMRQEALKIARQADIIVAAMGEACEMSGESSSRVNLEMPDAQHDLLVELSKLGKPIVLVHFAGRPTVLNWETKHLPAILENWFTGSEAGDALADVLLGKVAPSGRLTTSLPRHVGQLPYSYRHYNTGRPYDGEKFQKFVANYADVAKTPLYPFGYGLSYTTFDYSQFTLDASEMSFDGSVTATVQVTNTGKREGDEVVQLYIRDDESLPVRPLLELRAFKRIHLQPGETQSVAFTLTRDELACYDATGQQVLQPGTFSIYVGKNVAELLPAQQLTVQ